MRKLLKNLFLLLVAIGISLSLAELVLRIKYEGVIDPWDFKNNQFISFSQHKDIRNEVYNASVGFGLLHGMDTSLFHLMPALRTYGKYRDETKFMEQHTAPESVQEVMKQWNYNFVLNTFKYDSLRYRDFHFRFFKDGLIYAFKPYDSTEYPVYRYFANSRVQGDRMRFNKFGWTGTDLDFIKPPRTIRIAFLGGSTTQQYPGSDFSYPDYIETWLNAWAAKQSLNLKFEVINAGRVAQRSVDFVNIFKYELQPVQPDIVVYYEGRNQFIFNNLLLYKHGFKNSSFTFCYNLLGRSILLQSLFNRFGITYYDFLEKKKNYVSLNWPASVNENNPDLQDKNLPVDLFQITQDIDKIINNCDSARQAFILCSFAMAANDTIFGTPAHNYIYDYWLHDFDKTPMKDVVRLNQFENRVFKKLTNQRQLPFVDISAAFAAHPDFFDDGIHLNPEGMKYQAWVVMQCLIPLIDQKVKAGQWPYSAQATKEHPYVKDDAFLVDLNKLKSK